jgi:hypothetical protein
MAVIREVMLDNRQAQGPWGHQGEVYKSLQPQPQPFCGSTMIHGHTGKRSMRLISSNIAAESMT